MNVPIPQNCYCYNTTPPSGREGCTPHQPLCPCVGISVYVCVCVCVCVCPVVVSMLATIRARIIVFDFVFVFDKCLSTNILFNYFL